MKKSQMQNRRKLIVVGGGAAGFFCAINAARMSEALDVCVLEKSGKLLSKVKISGGGRCNVTHDESDLSLMSAAYPRGKNLLKKTLYQFSPQDTVSWFKERGVTLKTEPDGRMFPTTNQSQTIIDCLMKEAHAHGIEIKLHHEVVGFSRDGEKSTILVKNQHGELINMDADYVCVAAGGYPKSSSFAWLNQTRHSIVDPLPSLFTFNIPDKHLHALMGISCEHAGVKIPVLKIEEEGPVLITHWGLSGPATLKLSSRAARDLYRLHYAFEIKLNWTPAFHESTMFEKLKEVKEKQRSSIGVKNPFALSVRLWEYLLRKAEIDPSIPWVNTPQAALAKLSKVVCSDTYRVDGKTTFKEEFVTSGGIDLSEIDAQTMESKLIPGLYFAGEIMDVDGITGGYNFQHAWSSGMIVARAISSQLQL